jgi:hypothetical protein
MPIEKSIHPYFIVYIRGIIPPASLTLVDTFNFGTLERICGGEIGGLEFADPSGSTFPLFSEVR